MRPIIFAYEKLTESPSVGTPGRFYIPPNQDQFAQILWGHVNAQVDVRLSQTNIVAPPGVIVTFGHADDNVFPALTEMDLGFNPGEPTVAFRVGVALTEGALEMGSISITPELL